MSSNNHAGRILVVDNNPRLREATQTLLNLKGYQTYTASTVENAAEIVQQERVHLALVDVRMRGDSDPYDKSGLEFAFRLDPVVAVVVTTAFQSLPDMADLLRQTTVDRVIDYIPKKDGPQKLLDAVEQAFERIEINFDLQIHWQSGLSRNHLLEELNDQSNPPKITSNDIEELFFKLFYEAKEIVVSPLVSVDYVRLSSQTNSVVLRVDPLYKKGGWGTPVVVKLAGRENIVTEARNYDQSVKNFIVGFRRANLEKFVETHCLGGLIYSLIGTSLNQTMSLASFYDQRNTDATIATLESLIKDACRLWYAGRTHRREVDLAQMYVESVGLSVDKIHAALYESELEELVLNHRLKFPGLAISLINPVQWYQKHNHWVTSVYTCYTHGDLHCENILVDDVGQLWLIDYFRTGEGHILRDIIELETDIKFNLLNVTEPRNLFKFEMAVLSPDYLGDALPPPLFDDPELVKAYKVVAALREFAQRLLGPKVSMQEYYWGLFVMTLNVIRLKKIKPPKKQHALLAAALLASRLQNWVQLSLDSTSDSTSKTVAPEDG